MGYDNVLKDIQKRERAAGAELIERKRKAAAIMQDNIFNVLPQSEEDAVSAVGLKTKFPNEITARISANLFFLFKRGRCRRVKRYDEEFAAAHTHCYYWKETEKTIVEILQLNGCEINRDARDILYEMEELYEMWKKKSPTYILNPMRISIPTFRADKDFIPPANTLAISASLFQLLSDISGISDEYIAIKKISDITGCNEKKAKEIRRIAKDETIMNRINQGRVPNFIDSIRIPLFELLEHAHPTIREKGEFYEWIEEHGLKQKRINKNAVSFFKEYDLEKYIEYDNRMGQQKVVQILDGASKNKNEAISGFIINNLLKTKEQGRTIAGLRGLSNNEYTINTIWAELSKLVAKNKIKELKVNGVFYYWKEDEIKDTERRLTLRQKLLKELSTNKASAISCKDILKRGTCRPHNRASIASSLTFLHATNRINREKEGSEFYYWRNNTSSPIIKEATVAISSSNSSIKELISSYKADNKKLDERILNIEKQIADLGQKQELQAEIQKREENETRLAELEEQLHKIAIADTSVKRGILH